MGGSSHASLKQTPLQLTGRLCTLVTRDGHGVTAARQTTSFGRRRVLEVNCNAMSRM